MIIKKFRFHVLDSENKCIYKPVTYFDTLQNRTDTWLSLLSAIKYIYIR